MYGGQGGGGPDPAMVRRAQLLALQRLRAGGGAPQPGPAQGASMGVMAGQAAPAPLQGAQMGAMGARPPGPPVDRRDPRGPALGLPRRGGY